MSKLPTYTIIKKHLWTMIDRGVWRAGYKVPPEEALQERYKVSRGTVRQALAELEAEGFIVRKPGQGTFVRHIGPTFESVLGDADLSYSPLPISSTSGEITARVLAVKTIPMSEARAKPAEACGVALDGEVIFIHYLQESQGQPLAIHSLYLFSQQFSIRPGENLEEFLRLYREWRARHVAAIVETVRASGALKEETELLRLHIGDPVIIRERTCHDPQHNPFEVLHAVEQASRFTYRLERQS